PRRRDRRARQPRPRPRASRHWSKSRGHRLPLLQYHVPRRPHSRQRSSTPTSRHSPTNRPSPTHPAIRRDAVKIVVAIKQVPERHAPIHIASDGKWIDDADLNYTINEPDAYALEEALQLKEKQGTGEVIVVCAGPERVQTTLREALAKGADRAIHIEADSLT